MSKSPQVQNSSIADRVESHRHTAFLLKLNRIAMFDGSKGNIEAPTFMSQSTSEMYTVGPLVYRESVRRPRVSPMFRKRAGRCCPLAGAPTSTRRRSKLGMDKQPAGISYLPLCKLAVGAYTTTERGFYFSVGGVADRDSVRQTWTIVPRDREVIPYRPSCRRHLDAGFSFLIASSSRQG